jgi:toxin ParE1/3/4
VSVPRRPVRLSPDAQRDYDNILLDSFQTWGESQMLQYQAALDRGLIRIGDYPEIGVRRDQLLPGSRSIRVEHHVLYYRIKEDEIEIIRILHERMDASRHLSP